MIPSRKIARCLAGIASAVVVVALGAASAVNAFVTPPSAPSSLIPSPSRGTYHSPLTTSSSVTDARHREARPFRLHGLFGNDSGRTTNNEAATKVILSLKANEVKVGALRFLLQIYLVGEQNNPVPKSWLTKAGDDSGELLVYYGDGSGMVKIQLNESGVEFQRVGNQPSLPYLLQESVLLHGILDELEHVAFGVEDIDETKRLLRLSDPTAVAAERAKLPARQLGS